MLHLPPEFTHSISAIFRVFGKPTLRRVKFLLLAAVLCPGKRTVCNLLRSGGLSWARDFPAYHRVLSRAKWSALQAAGILLSVLIDQLQPPEEPLVFGIDETLERRWGPKIKKRGIYRDAVRSSKSFFVKASGLRWMCMMLLCPLPDFLGRTWALPFFTALCPSERYYEHHRQGRRAKTLNDWAAQMILQLRRWTKHLHRAVYLVADGSYATYRLLDLARSHEIHMIVRMRFDARIFDFPQPPPPGRPGRKPKVGARQMELKQRLESPETRWKTATFSDWYGHKEQTMLLATGTGIWYKPSEPRVPIRWVLIKHPERKTQPALIATTDLDISIEQIVRFFVRRWRVEVTFAEVRRHLGVETQRQWADLAIERSTPALMALFSIVTLWAWMLKKRGTRLIKATAWYNKTHITFSDALAAVRTHIYQHNHFSTSTLNPEVEKLPPDHIQIWNIIASNVA